MTRSLVVVLVAASLALAGCGLVPQTEVAYPGGCVRLGFSELRCRAIVSRATEQAGLQPDDVANVSFHADVPDRIDEGRQVVAVVRLSLRGGGERVEEVSCFARTIGKLDDPVCNPQAQIEVGAGIDHDVSCPGEPPAGCWTLPPEPRPASVAVARPLRVDRLDIPIERIGGHEIEVGDAGIPDGYLTERTLTLANPSPDDFWIDGGIRLEVRSVDRPDMPFGSRYREPFEGVERAKVFLVFQVSEASPGAVLEVRDIVVR